MSLFLSKDGKNVVKDFIYNKFFSLLDTVDLILF
jgi:hypothetical protein